MSSKDGQVLKWLSIRLTEAESDALTMLRAEFELRTRRRVTIKQMLRILIVEAVSRRRAHRLRLPTEKVVPVIGRSEQHEHITWELTPEEAAAFGELCLHIDGSAVGYGPADIVREVVRLAFEKMPKVMLPKETGE